MRKILRLIIALLLLYSCKNERNIENLYIGIEPEIIKERISRFENGLQEAVLLSDNLNKTYSLLDRMEYFDVPALSIAVIKDNQIEWAKSYGLKVKNSSDSVSLSTRFQAASLSKPLTALIALKMVEKGLIKLDSSVNNQLTTWKIPANNFTANVSITPKHLILHTSGLNVPGYPGYHIDSDIPTLIELLNGTGASNTEPTEVLATPNTKWIYSGAGYSVLQLLMTEKTGLSFSDLMDKELFEPLKISNSTFEQDNLKNIALAYLESGEMVDKGYHIYPELAAAGLWTTPIDYAKIICELQKSFIGWIFR